MIEVREAFEGEAENICERFKVKAMPSERVIALTDGDKAGVGLTRFESGAIRIRLFVTDGDEGDFELLKRFMMFDASRMSGYRVYIEQDGDYSVYGFAKGIDGWSAKAEEITFPHGCK